MDDGTCLECSESFNTSEAVRRHLRKHGMTAQQYVLKWVHKGTVPKCGCGCGKDVAWNSALKGYATFVHGHHSVGHEVSVETRKKIGEKNSINMKRFMADNPDIVKQRVEQMHAGLTPEIVAARTQSTIITYEQMTAADKAGFASRTRQRWQAGVMKEPHIKAARTFKQRSEAGQYDFDSRNQKLSEVISKKYTDGTWRFSKGTHVSSKTGRSHYYRSSWEQQLMSQLDTDPDVVTWESEFIALPYSFDGTTHRYVPDFHVVRKSTGDWLIEVKPQSLRVTARNSAKRAAAQEHCSVRGWQYEEWSPVT